MFNQKFLAGLKTSYQEANSERRQIISASNNILFEAKKTIFALQKSDFKKAESNLKEMEADFLALEKKFSPNRLNKEGAFKAAAEEYMEAKTFFLIIKDKKIEEVKGLNFDYEAYLGGVCDMIGELVRYATNQAAQGRFAVVAKVKKKAEVIMEDLADFDMTSYLRTKYDQARGHLRKLEQMAYEIKLRGRK
ncbi:hypothetical protein GW758_00680 [Candidatus Falkowbacteria bacterium]|nr:hypothetical protein [Candidatus Falkowbacteria bacterium]NCT54460.1 hypothetical protein [Candidatus Falkowbacteria bacterium]